MIYNSFQNEKLSALGMGCMRLPVMADNPDQIDKEQTQKMLAFAMQNGVNYYDTAYVYHRGESENVMGELLQDYPRDSFYLADKFPGFSQQNLTHVKEIFEEQLQKCRVDYFDFYLVHSVSDGNIDAYLDPQYGLHEYLLEQKKNGRIRHLGFSTHGCMDTVKRFLAVWEDDIEFCQIQLNYLDWTYQHADEKVKLLTEKNIPVWVMEPVRGGRLAKLTSSAEEKLKALRPDESIPAWAFRWLQSIPQVVVTLSGMSNMAQLQDNLKTFSAYKPLNADEQKAVTGIAADIMKNAVPCTGCRYCVTECPQGLDIPALLAAYNRAMVDGAGNFKTPGDLKDMPADKLPSACLACGACQAVCPQSIQIPATLADFAARLN